MFAGILKNWLFVVVMLFTLVGQWAIIEYGGDWVGCTPLTNDEWLICIGLGALSIPVCTYKQRCFECRVVCVCD